MNSLIKKINRTVEFLMVLFLIIMVLVVFFQIVSRTIWGSSFLWTEEVARFLMIWVMFLGSALAFQYGAHISIEAIFNRLPSYAQKSVQIIITIVCITFFLIFMVEGFDLSQRAMVNRSPALNIPMGYVYSVIPITGMLGIINLIDVTIRYLRTGKNSLEVME